MKHAEREMTFLNEGRTSFVSHLVARCMVPSEGRLQHRDVREVAALERRSQISTQPCSGTKMNYAGHFS